MKICKHPQMEGDCFNGKEICCKYCDQISDCIKAGTGLCPYIDDKNDFNETCPFEEETN